MPSKVQFYSQMADNAAVQITGSYQNWLSFLKTAARLYKYPYHEQLMIHAQCPDATACAEFDFLNRQAPLHERTEIAQSLWYLYQDLSEEARDIGFLSYMENMKGGGLPDETERLAEQLALPRVQEVLASEVNALYIQHFENPNLLRFRYHKLDKILDDLKDLSLPRTAYSSFHAELPQPQGFITEDEIAEALSGGSSMEGGKGRYLAVRLLHAPAISLTAGQHFTDTTNAYRAYSRTYLEDKRVLPLRDVFSGYELLAYLSVRATQLGMKACEIPVCRAYPKGEKTPTKISPWKGNINLLKILLANAEGQYKYME